MMAKKKAAKRKKKASSTTGNTAARTKKKAKVVSRPAAPAGKKSKSKAAVRSELTSCKSEFPIVGLGASAGGLEALQEFFDKIPKRCEMGFVVVTHQHPGHTSLLPELLASHTEMPVVEASDATKIQANHVYVGPPGGNLAMLNGTLHLIVAEADQSSAGPRAKRPKARGDYRLHLPIDRFLRSLAEDQRERAICIILSGTGTDGTLGLRAIKAESGMAMVQEPGSAKYGGMPSSALATGLADFVLPPNEMPKHLMAYAKTPYLAVEEAAVELPREPVERIFLLLRTRTGHDFSSYKTTTIRRRIERRMGVHQINGPAAYVKYLQRNAHEIDILFKELLISVTSFFRDEQAWAALAKTALPNLIDSRPDNYNFRAWVPGCATGEEAFTIAILLRETAEQLGKHFDYQIFGTDLDAGAIEAARAGVYPDGIAVDVATGLLERYFHREDSTYRVRKEIREMCVFAPQNFIKDPPFTKLDLVCCRNLLIYLNADMQQRLLPIFHYALKPGGVLMLGPSETIGTHIGLFKAADKKWKIFTREETIANARVPNIPAQRVVTPDDPGPGATPAGPGAIKDSEVGKVVDRLLLARYAPASVVVNERGDIIYIHGRTGLYLEPAAGRPHMNAIEMAREGLEFELSACIRQAASGDDDVRREAVRMLTNGGQIYVDISVSRITDSKTLRGLLLITLKPAASPPVELPKKKARRGKAKHDPVAQLERELQYTKESLQTTVEELETSNEELKSTNEELQSTNEELQSSNEELETSKEEMQSLNEELNTVNAEMQGKLDELSRANDDLYNLLNSTEVATIFLDMQLRIKRFTDSARRLIKVIPSDVGRSIGDLKTNLKYDSLEDDARDVLRTLVWKEAELSTPDGQRFLMRIIPYRTVDNVIDGLVITFVDTQPLREAQNRLRESERELTLLSDLSPLLISYVDKDQRYVFTNKTYEKITGLASDQLRGMTVREVIGDEAYEVGLPHVEAVLRGNPRKFENELPRGDGGTYIAMMQFEPRRDESGEVIGFYVLATDVTDQKRVDAARAMAESIVATVREPLVVLDEGLRVVQCNRAFYDVFQLRDRQVVGELIYDASGAAWDNPKLRRLLEEILPHDTTVENFEITHTFPGAGRKQLLLNARRLHRALGLPAMILLAMEDVTRAGP